jgi:hypothetical protein
MAAKCAIVLNLNLNLGNLILWARSELNGLSGKDSELFWSTGVLECWKKLKPEFQLE